MKRYDIAVAGTGYVGMSLATLLAQHNRVTAVDVLAEKVEKSTGAFLPYRTNTSRNTSRKSRSTSPRRLTAHRHTRMPISWSSPHLPIMTR